MSSSRTRWYAILAGAAGVLGALGVIAPEIYTATVSDIGTFLRVVGVVGVVSLWVIGIRRLVPHRSLSLCLAVVPVLVVSGTLIWPYLRSPTEVDEALPPAVAITATPLFTTSVTAHRCYVSRRSTSARVRLLLSTSSPGPTSGA